MITFSSVVSELRSSRSDWVVMPMDCQNSDLES